MQVSDLTTPLGKMTLLAEQEQILGLWFEGQKHFGSKYNLKELKPQDTPFSLRVQHYLDDYFAGKRSDFSELSFAPEGTPFQRAVWSVLDEIPYGQVATYQEVADRVSVRLGRLTHPRPVASAIGRNPIVLMRPCHRVVGKDGSLTGYAGGIARKQALLALEGPSSLA